MQALTSKPPVDGSQSLFFGLGAQKSGSTWLYNYLENHPQAYVPRVKETDFFYTLERGAQRERATLLIRSLYSHLQCETDTDALMEAPQTARIGDLASLLAAVMGRASYLSLYDGRNGIHRVYGEISPSYSMLNRETYAKMAAIAPNVRFFFVMRDPVQRYWSSVRMLISRRSEVLDRHGSVSKVFHENLARKNSHLVRMTDYLATIEELESVVPSENVHYVFYEDLFKGDEARSMKALKGLCEFLGIGITEAEFSRRIWQTDETKVRANDLDQSMLEAALRHFEPVYNGIRARFADAVPAEWHNPQDVLQSQHATKGGQT